MRAPWPAFPVFRPRARGFVTAEKLIGQFDYLNRLRKERKVVSLYLVSGIRFLGRVVSFDREGLLLDTKQGPLLFSQRQISTIGPDAGKPRRIGTGEPGERGERHERHDRHDRHERHDRYERPDRPMADRQPYPESADGLREPGYTAPVPRPAPTVQIIRKARREIRRDSEE